jgi:hypothetical protein
LGLEHVSDEYVNWLNDAEVIRYLETGGDYTREKLQDFLSSVEKNQILFWAIHLKSNNKHIGNINIFNSFIVKSKSCSLKVNPTC